MGTPSSIRRRWSGLSPRLWRSLLLGGLAAPALLAGGCASGPRVLKPMQQVTLDRGNTEYPTGFELKPYMVNLTAPTAMCWDSDGRLIVAEGGDVTRDPHVFRVFPDGSTYDIYPKGPRIPFLRPGFRIYGPVGGMVSYNNKVYVSHRDENDNGVITAFSLDGSTHTTVVGLLPAQGDYGVTDMVVQPESGTLYFGVGAVTNSGVVGLDNWQEGWVRKHPKAHDIPYTRLTPLGKRFDSKNPKAGLFNSDFAVTSPFQPFGDGDVRTIPAAPNGRPGSAIYAVPTDGGGPEVVATGLRNPAGLAADRYTVYVADQGMELRGTRPVGNDPDGVFRLFKHEWYGWPDFSRSLQPISDPRFQPPAAMLSRSAYHELAALIDHDASDLRLVNNRAKVAELPPLSGASKMDVVPASGPFNRYVGDLIVCLWGDRAPFATSGVPLKGPTGYKVVLVNPTGGAKTVTDFVFNTRGGPLSQMKHVSEGLERPIDAKFGPDGNLYLLDAGKTIMKNGKPRVTGGTGMIYRLVPIATPTTQPR